MHLDSEGTAVGTDSRYVWLVSPSGVLSLAHVELCNRCGSNAYPVVSARRRTPAGITEDSGEEGEEEEEEEEEEESSEEETTTTKKGGGQKADDDESEEDDTDLINPNHVAKKLTISDIGAPREMSRREREQKEKQEAKERYMKVLRSPGRSLVD
jgi:hypothetical protein